MMKILNCKLFFKLSFVDEIHRNFYPEFNQTSIPDKSLDYIKDYFQKNNPSHVSIEDTKKIKEYAMICYNKAHFYQFNQIFSKHIKHIRTLSSYESKDFAIKYFISSIFKRNFEMCIMELEAFSYNTGVEVNLYKFLINIIMGKFKSAGDLIMSIKEDTFYLNNSLINEQDLALYFALCLLINYDEEKYSDIKNQIDSFANRLIFSNPEYRLMIENFQECRFELVIEQFAKIKEKLKDDPLFINVLHDFETSLKFKIIKEILSYMSVVSIEYIAKILREDLNTVEKRIISGITSNKFQATIDEVEKVIYFKKVNSKDNLISQTIEQSKKSNNFMMKKVLDYYANSVIEVLPTETQHFKKYMINK